MTPAGMPQGKLHAECATKPALMCLVVYISRLRSIVRSRHCMLCSPASDACRCHGYVPMNMQIWCLLLWHAPQSAYQQLAWLWHCACCMVYNSRTPAWQVHAWITFFPGTLCMACGLCWHAAASLRLLHSSGCSPVLACVSCACVRGWRMGLTVLCMFSTNWVLSSSFTA